MKIVSLFIHNMRELKKTDNVTIYLEFLIIIFGLILISKCRFYNCYICRCEFVKDYNAVFQNDAKLITQFICSCFLFRIQYGRRKEAHEVPVHVLSQDRSVPLQVALG